jgi:hypothetical protein
MPNRWLSLGPGDTRHRRGRNNGVVSLEDRDPESLTIADFFAFRVADDEAAAARERFCDIVALQLRRSRPGSASMHGSVREM